MTRRADHDDAPRISRRTVLGAAAAGAGALAVSGGLGLPSAAAATNPLKGGVPRDPAASGIEHVVVVMMENRSFDHMLGWLPGANGKQQRRFKDSAGVRHSTWHLDTFTGDGFRDPNHSYNGGRQEYRDGYCDGWLRTNNNDIYSIGYYEQDDLSFYGGAAPYWTVCDRFFASILGPTYPNRFYMHAAQTDRITNTFDIATLPTIWDSLRNAGLNGRYYYSDLPVTALWGGALTSISEPIANFFTACSSGNLPHVSYVEPRFLDTAGGAQCDDHPHADIRRGQHFLDTIYRAVTSGPQWENTVFVITYDEWGGFFDHVRPTTAPDNDPAHALRGFRIPTMVISPLARRQTVAHRNYDHSSILKLIEWRWGLPALSPRDAAARNLAEVLDFVNPPDLTAPLWDVPDPDALSPLMRSTLASTDEVGTADADEHAAEWRRIGDLAAQYGFAV